MFNLKWITDRKMTDFIHLGLLQLFKGRIMAHAPQRINPLSSRVIVYKTYCAMQWIDIWIATSRTNGTNMVPFFVFFWQQAASHSL